jgi:hypothetical protein
VAISGWRAAEPSCLALNSAITLGLRVILEDDRLRLPAVYRGGKSLVWIGDFDPSVPALDSFSIF